MCMRIYCGNGWARPCNGVVCDGRLGLICAQGQTLAKRADVMEMPVHGRTEIDDDEGG